jgi:hypothetical protein
VPFPVTIQLLGEFGHRFIQEEHIPCP